MYLILFIYKIYVPTTTGIVCAIQSIKKKNIYFYILKQILIKYITIFLFDIN